LNLEIQPNFADRLRQLGVDTGTRIAMSSRRYMRLGLTLRSEAIRFDSASELVIEGLAMEVIGQLIRNRAGEETQRKEHWLETVNEMLHDRFRESVSLKELAEISQVHPVHLARAFRKRYGCSVGDYVRRLRVLGAASEIEGSDMSIAEIASRNGFSDQSHLCRLMKDYTGRSPRQFRSKREIGAKTRRSA
jgi:AraC family transcriptional regulator